MLLLFFKEIFFNSICIALKKFHISILEGLLPVRRNCLASKKFVKCQQHFYMISAIGDQNHNSQGWTLDFEM